MKTCFVCKVEKPLEEFNRHKGQADGRQQQCRECQRARNTAYREANREKLAAAARQQRRTAAPLTEEQKKEQSARYKKWYEQNREKRLKYHREYRQENREAISAREAKRYQNDPHVSARRLIQSRVQYGLIPRVTTLPCHDCGQQAEEYDHYMGYEGKAREMVQPVCKPCHRQREMLRKEAS